MADPNCAPPTTSHGTYRTRYTILALYDQFADCQRNCQPSVSPLDPPPGDPRACHPPLPLHKRRTAEVEFEALTRGW